MLTEGVLSYTTLGPEIRPSGTARIAGAQPILGRYGLSMQEGDEVLVLETLRSMSGRLALRLESGRNQTAEVIGLLLARWLRERLGLLERRIVILALYAASKGQPSWAPAGLTTYASDGHTDAYENYP